MTPTSSAATPTARRQLSVLGEDFVPLLRSAEFEVHEASGPVESGPPPHSHPWDEGYIVLAGALTVGADGTETTLSAGESLLVTAGTTHWYRIAAPGTRFLTCTAGTGAGRFFDDLDASVPHGIPGPETMPQIVEVAKRNGLSSPLF